MNLLKKLSLCELPECILLEVLNKLEPKSLIRLRRTCRTLDAFVKKYNKKLSARPLHLEISINIAVFENQTIAIYNKDPYDLVVPPVEQFNEDCEMRLSGLSFKSIEVTCHRGPEHFQKLVEYLKQMKPTCYEFEATESKWIGPLTEHVTILGRCGRLYVQTNEVLDKLALAKNRSKFELHCDRTCDIDYDIFGSVKNFKEVDLYARLEAFYQFLLELHRSKEKFPLKRLRVFLPSFTDLSVAHKNVAIPPLIFKTLREPWKESMWDNYFLRPSYFYLITLPNQFVVVTCQYKPTYDVEMHFVNKTNEDVLRILTKICGIFPGDEYEEEKLQKLRAVVQTIF